MADQALPIYSAPIVGDCGICVGCLCAFTYLGQGKTVRIDEEELCFEDVLKIALARARILAHKQRDEARQN